MCMGFIDINLDFGSLVPIAWREGKLELKLPYPIREFWLID